MRKPKSVFLDALERPREEREAFLCEHCPDAKCRERVRALLAAHERDGALLNGSALAEVRELHAYVKGVGIPFCLRRG